jgi:hypothetical protein
VRFHNFLTGLWNYLPSFFYRDLKISRFETAQKSKESPQKPTNSKFDCHFCVGSCDLTNFLFLALICRVSRNKMQRTKKIYSAHTDWQEWGTENCGLTQSVTLGADLKISAQILFLCFFSHVCSVWGSGKFKKCLQLENTNIR